MIRLEERTIAAEQRCVMILDEMSTRAENTELSVHRLNQIETARLVVAMSRGPAGPLQVVSTRTATGRPLLNGVEEAIAPVIDMEKMRKSVRSSGAAL